MCRFGRHATPAELDSELPRLADGGLGGGEFIQLNLDAQKSPAIVASLVWHGFLPMGSGGDLLGKLHRSRCVLAPGSVHVGRKTRRRSKSGFRLTVDSAWDLVVAGVQQHTWTNRKGDCWLTNQVAAAYQAVNHLDDKQRCGIEFHSIELWHVASGTLVAGEIGYSCGAVYSSCTGFALKDEYPGVGSLQLAALGNWLARSDFEVWDLGMGMAYKLELGGTMVPRAEWLKTIRALRQRPARLVSPKGDAAVLLGGCEQGISSGPLPEAAPPETSPEAKTAALATPDGTEDSGRVGWSDKADINEKVAVRTADALVSCVQFLCKRRRS